MNQKPGARLLIPHWGNQRKGGFATGPKNAGCMAQETTDGVVRLKRGSQPLAMNTRMLRESILGSEVASVEEGQHPQLRKKERLMDRRQGKSRRWGLGKRTN